MLSQLRYTIDRSGAQIELSSFSKSHVEMDLPGTNGSMKRLKSHVVRLVAVPTITARMSRTKRNTVVVDWSHPENIACIRSIR